MMTFDSEPTVTVIPGKKIRKNKHGFKRILNCKEHRQRTASTSMHITGKYPKRVKR